MKTKQYLLRISGKTAFIALFLWAATACKVVDGINPDNAIGTDLAFTTADYIERTVVGMYQQAAIGFYSANSDGAYGAARGYPLGAAAACLSEARGEDMVNNQQFFLIVGQNNFNSSSANIVGMWNNLFAVINRCNIVVEGVRAASASGVIPAATANGYEGEARFLRALCYYHLAIHFGRPYLDVANRTAANQGFPYYTTVINRIEDIPPVVGAPRGTIDQLYTNIIADLNYCETNLPVNRSPAARNITRCASSDAIALKQRMYLTMGQWANAVTEGQKIINQTVEPFSYTAGGNTLQSGVDAPWLNNQTAESMFSLEMTAASNPGVNGSLPSAFAPQGAPFNGRGLMQLSPNLWNAFWWPLGDTRRSNLFFSPTAGATVTGPGQRFTVKYRDGANRTDFAPVIRYAEVLLNQAEAIARQTVNTNQPSATTAFNLLAAVRNRANSNVADRWSLNTALFPTLLDSTFFNDNVLFTSDQLVDAIMKERRIELAGEGFRWADLQRTMWLRPNAIAATSSPSSGYDNGGLPVGTAPFYGVVAKNGQAPTEANYNAASGVVITTTVPALPYTDRRIVWPVPLLEGINNPTFPQTTGW